MKIGKIAGIIGGGLASFSMFSAMSTQVATLATAAKFTTLANGAGWFAGLGMNGIFSGLAGSANAIFGSAVTGGGAGLIVGGLTTALTTIGISATAAPLVAAGLTLVAAWGALQLIQKAFTKAGDFIDEKMGNGAPVVQAPPTQGVSAPSREQEQQRGTTPERAPQKSNPYDFSTAANHPADAALANGKSFVADVSAIPPSQLAGQGR